MKLREYQIKVINELKNELSENKHTIVRLPTGAGKTVIIASFIEEITKLTKKRVLILVHRNELIEQMYNKLLDVGVNASEITIMKGTNKNLFAPITITTIQTLYNVLKSYPEKFEYLKNGLGYICTDECHHCLSMSYTAVYNALPDALRIGLSATPTTYKKGRDGVNFMNHYDSMLTTIDYPELISQGYLVSPKVYIYPINPELLKGIKSTAGDYNEKQLYEFMSKSYTDAEVIKIYKQFALGKKTIIFCVNIQHAKEVSSYFTAHGFNAAYVSSRSEPEERKHIIQSFRQGRLDILVNVDIVSEGFDVPEIDCEILMRPTKSMILYMQQTGRVLRPAKDKEAIIIDLSNNVVEHDLPHVGRSWGLHAKVRKLNTKTAKFKIDDEVHLINPLNFELTTYDIVSLRKKVSKYGMDMNAPLMNVFSGNNGDFDLEGRERFFKQLLATAYNKGYKPYWAYFQYEKLYPVMQMSELRMIAKHLKFNDSWCYAKQKEMELKKVAPTLNLSN